MEALTFVLIAVWARWLYRRPAYRRVMQYGWARRMRVGKALRQGRIILEQDMDVAASLVGLQRKQWWFPWLYCALAAVWVANSFTHHGLVGFLYLGAALVYLLLLPLIWRQRRKTIANYDLQRAILTADTEPESNQ